MYPRSAIGGLPCPTFAPRCPTYAPREWRERHTRAGYARLTPLSCSYAPGSTPLPASVPAQAWSAVVRSAGGTTGPVRKASRCRTVRIAAGPRLKGSKSPPRSEIAIWSALCVRACAGCRMNRSRLGPSTWDLASSETATTTSMAGPCRGGVCQPGARPPGGGPPGRRGRSGARRSRTRASR